jgi:hypothetical protein
MHTMFGKDVSVSARRSLSAVLFCGAVAWDGFILWGGRQFYFVGRSPVTVACDVFI